MPERARRYLSHAVASDAPEAHSVRLGMRGQISLKGRWMPFAATQWLAPHEGFHWRATVRRGPLRIKGFDRYSGGRGEMRWRLLGLVPLVHESGPEIDRSARGRLAAEAIWAPTALLPRLGVRWSEEEDGWIRAQWPIDGVEEQLRLEVDSDGRLLRLRTSRWGNPDGRGWRSIAFGGVVESEAKFQGITIPTRVSAGWWFGTKRFRLEGEFFRVAVEELVPE